MPQKDTRRTSSLLEGFTDSDFLGNQEGVLDTDGVYSRLEEDAKRLLGIEQSKNEYKRIQNEQIYDDATLNIDNGSLSFDLGFKLENQFGEGYYGAQGLREAFQFKTPEEEQKFAKDYVAGEKVRKIKSTVNTPSLINSLERGVYQGLEQNVELLTGLDSKNHGELSVQELDDLRNTGYITTEEYTEFLEKRNALPFLTSLTAAVTNSLLIAFELPTAGTVSLTGAGAKTFSWTGLKFYGKEILKQGKNSWKLMGPGANIRATRESVKEIQELDDPTSWDYAGILLKNYFKENVQAFAEGASEGLLRNMKMANVNVGRLKSFKHDEWVQLAKNLGRKSIQGLFFESATEQTTDILQDVLEGTKSSVPFAFIAGTGEEKKQALENLAIEGLTGWILGHSLGMAEVFQNNIYNEVVDEVKAGNITEKEGEILLDVVRDEEAQKNLTTQLREINKKRQMPEDLRQAANTLDAFQRFGSRIDPNFQPHPADQEFHTEALKRVEQELPGAMVRTDEQLVNMVMDKHLNPNILDAVHLLGKENFFTYIKSMQDQDLAFNFLEDFVQNNPAYNLPDEILNEITSKAMIGLTKQSVRKHKGLLDELNVAEAKLDEISATLLEQDVIAGLALDFDSLGWGMLSQKWKGQIDDIALNKILDRAKTINNSSLRVMGERVLSSSFAELSDRINQEITEQAAKAQDAARRNISEEKNALDDALGEVIEEDEGYSQKVFDTTPYQPDAEKIAKALGARFEGFQQFRKATLAIFSTQDRKITKAVPVPEGLTVGTVGEALRGEGYAQRQINNNPNIPTYGEQLKDFNGKTLGDLFHFIKGRELGKDTAFIALQEMLPGLKNIPIRLVTDKEAKGVVGYYVPGSATHPEEIWLNKEAKPTDRYDLGDSVLHEAVHAYTVKWMKNTKEGQVFRAQLSQLIAELNSITNISEAVRNKLWMGTEDQLKQWLAIPLHVQLLNDMLSSPEEFIAVAISDTSNLSNFLSFVSAAALPTEGGIKQQGQQQVPTTTIISGGQIGADRAGLQAAKQLGLQTGGTAPKGFRTSTGADITLKNEFGLVEDDSSNYQPRTEKNVVNSNATVIFGSNMESPGSKLTIKLARQHSKPLAINPTANELRNFLISNNVKTLNVAGNRTADIDGIINTISEAMQPSTQQQTTGSQNYKGGFENIGKGTPEGDGKDKAMREVADGFIGEVVSPTGKSSSNVSANVIAAKQPSNQTSYWHIPNEFYPTASPTVSVFAGLSAKPSQKHKVKMLARNSEFRGKPLSSTTKEEINTSHLNGNEFVVGDMPNVDSQFIDYLQEIGAKFTIYHTGSTSRITLAQTTTNTVAQQESQNMWTWLWNKLTTAWKGLFKPATKGNAYNAIVDLMRSYSNKQYNYNVGLRDTPRAIRDLRAASMETKTFGALQELQKTEHLDNDETINSDGQDEDVQAQWEYSNNFLQLASDIDGTTVSEFRDSIKKLPTVLHFMSLMDDLDAKSKNAITNRIDKLWDEGGYKERVDTREEFETRFLTGIYAFLKSSKPVQYVTLKTNWKGKFASFEVVKQPFVFTNGDGTTQGSYGRTTVLDSFLPIMDTLFGLEPGTMSIAYSSGYETYRNSRFQSRVNNKKLSPYHIGENREEDLNTENLANKIFNGSAHTDTVYVYLGNFGGNNTLPLMAIPKDKLPDVLDKAKSLLRSLGEVPSGTGATLTKALRLALEDTWYGRPPIDNKFADNSVFKTGEFGDLNKIWKRGKKFLVEENYIATDIDNIKRIIGSDTFTGIQINGGAHKDVLLNTAVFNSADNGFIDVITGYEKNQPVIKPIALSQVLINDYGTEKTDGVIFYLIDEFDKIYHNVHGTIKDGMLKNVYASRQGEEPLYLKHSMQGVTRDSAIGQMMIKNNVALLVSDTAAKIFTGEKVMLSQGFDKQNVFQLNLKNFQRISESLYTDVVGGTVKQMLNSSGLTKGNPLLNNITLADAYHKAVANFTNASSQIALRKVNEMSTPEGLLKIFRGIVENPQSPRERAIAKIFSDVLTMSNEDFLSSYGGIINHPTVAGQIRQRLYKPLDSAIQGRIGGMRATLRADVGYLNAPANVDPVNNPYNIDMLLLNQPTSATVLKKALPEKGLPQLVHSYLELQRMESRMLTKKTHNESGYQITDEQGEVENVNQRRYIAWKKNDIKSQIRALAETTEDPQRKEVLMSGDIRRVINKQDPAVQKWRDNIIFGEEAVDEKGNITRPGVLLDPESGSLKEDWVVVTGDFANTFGVKPGDKLIAVITPTDSPLGVISVRIGGVAPVYGKKSTDRASVVFNSEYIQSIVGKDFDIDTISLIPYDPDYWNPEDFDNVWATLLELKGQYKSWLAKEASETLGKKVNENQVFEKDTYPAFMEKYITEKLGNEDTGRLAGVKEFNANDHFFAIDRAYLVDPNKAIVRRQMHTMLSAIDFETKQLDVNKSKDRWSQAHLLHLIDTNFSVDFPNKTSRLLYNPPSSSALQVRFATREIGRKITRDVFDTKHRVDIEAHSIKNIGRFFRWMFGDALNLARGANALTGESLDYYTFKKMLERQQSLLTLVKAGRMEELINMFTTEALSKEKPEMQTAINNGLKLEMEDFSTSDILDYPLFRMIMNLDVNALPMPGSSYQDWLIDQTVATREVIETSTYLSHIFNKYVKEDAKKAQDHLTAPDGRQYDGVTKYAVWLSLFPLELDYQKQRKNQPNSLDAVRNEVITLIQAYDEVNSTESNPTITANRKGRAMAYPMLFKETLKIKAVSTKYDGIVKINKGNTGYGLSVGKSGKLLIGISGGVWRNADDILAAKDEEAAQILKDFTEQGGVWEDTNNRLALTQYMSLVANVPGDARMQLAKDHIAKRVYGQETKFSRSDVQALWLSFLGQVSQDGAQDNKTPGLITAQYGFDPNNPTDFQGNDIAMELLAEFEPSLFRQWIGALSFLNQNMNRQVQEMGITRLSEDSEGPGEIFAQTRFDETNGPESVKFAFKMLTDEILSLKTDMSMREFRRAIDKDGYKGGLKILKGMVKNDALIQALAQSDIFFGELLHDIHNLSSAAFQKKYDGKDPELINIVGSQILHNTDYIDHFLTEQFSTENYDNYENIPKLLELFAVLKAAQKTKLKADKELNPVARKLGINYISYKSIAPLKETKVYSTSQKMTVVDQQFGVRGREILTVDDVDIHSRIYATRTHQAHGESAVAIAKSQTLNTTINRLQTEFSNLVKDADLVADAIVDEKAKSNILDERSIVLEPDEIVWIKRKLAAMKDINRDEVWDTKRAIFDTAENMIKNLGIDIIAIGDEITAYRDLETGITFKSKTELIDGVFGRFDAKRQLEIYSALHYRELYDVQVPTLIARALDYLENAKKILNQGGNFDSILEIQALIDRYGQYRSAIESKLGGYMPHTYPIEVYKTWWYSEYKQLLREKLLTKMMKEKSKLNQGKPGADVELATLDTSTKAGQEIFNRKLTQMLNNEWEEFRVGNPHSYIIPNFLARRIPKNFPHEYQKGTSEMHYKYISDLFKGIRNDLTYADWLTYKHKARKAGERSFVIELTKLWYADQIQNKMLHTKEVDVAGLRPGMNINFTHSSVTLDPEDFHPRQAGVQVWGVVDKVDLKNNKLHLKVDREKAVYKAKQALMNTASIMREMGVENQLAPMSLKQAMMLRNMLQRGYVSFEQFNKPLEELTVADAAELIMQGHEHVINNSDKVGVYDLDMIYTRDLRGRVQSKRINRYMRRGAIERLDGLAREFSQLKGDDGHFDSRVDAVAYGTLKSTAWGAGFAANAIKQSQAMLFLGMVVAPKAFVYNFLGAKMANLVDAPRYNLKLSNTARREWNTIKHKSPTSMQKKERDWYNTMVSLGLAENKDLVAISLQAGNIDPVDVLSEKGFFNTIRYLAKGILEGAEYESHLNKLDELRIHLIEKDFDQDVAWQLMEEENLWRARVNGLVNKKIHKRQLEFQKKLKFLKTKLSPNLTKEEQAAAIQKLTVEQASGVKDKRTFVEEANLTRTQSLQQAGKFVKNSILRGYFGLGLQARAESQRRPGFYIGYMTARDLGFTEEQAIQMGINSIEHRHAFYSAPYKQYGANTKLGNLMMQFSQYSWNAFERQYKIWKEGIPQFYRHWTAARIAGKNPFQAFWDTVIKRTTIAKDQYGKAMKNFAGKEIGEVNIAHYLFMRWAIGSMIMQAGTRAFYGVTNWQDPVTQMFYKFGDLVTDIFKGDLDDDELAELAWIMNDALFFVGVPYKLAMQFLGKDPNQSVTEHLQRGRIDDQVDFLFRLNNEVAVLRNGWLRNHPAYKRNLEQIDWWFDDFFTGVKFFGFSAPDKSGQPYMRWGFYPGFSDEFPFVLRKELKQIKPLLNLRYYDTNKQGLGGKGKEFQRLFELAPSPLTWIPYSDKPFYSSKRNRR